MEILGIDIGGSGIKGAIVDVAAGKMVTDRYRIPTPKPATPDAVTDTVAQVVKNFQWTGIIGCGFPAVVKNGVARTAANIDDSWIGVNVADIISSKTGCPTHVSNDVDAAGWAEMNYGAGKDNKGVVLILALGTGIGSSVFVDGHQLPNTELGHIIMRGDIAEKYASNSARVKNNLSWKKWGKRLNKYLKYIESILHPDLIILGGGVSKYHTEFFPYIKCKTSIKAAKLRNQAGIVGSACSARYLATKQTNPGN